MANEDIIDRLSEIFTRHGARSYQGGGVSITEHMLQTAAAAEGASCTPGVVAAALLHDVGHFITDFARLEDDPKHASMLEAKVDRHHENAGARMLQPYFSAEVVEPIRLHVQAKRYLSAIEKDYVKTLAPQALHTLGLQGGPMSPHDVAAFEENPYCRTAAMLRRWDDAAVVPGLKTPDFEHYRGILENLLTG